MKAAAVTGYRRARDPAVARAAGEASLCSGVDPLRRHITYGDGDVLAGLGCDPQPARVEQERRVLRPVDPDHERAPGILLGLVSKPMPGTVKDRLETFPPLGDVPGGPWP